jgi:hypothetical protein
MLSSRYRQVLLLLGAMVVPTLAAYWQLHRYNFVAYDDGPYVYRNQFVLQGFTSAGMRYAFTTFTNGNWNPLIWLSFFLDHALFHLRPGAMHMENVLLHLLSGILIWRLLVLATGNLYRSWMVAALFLLHPMHVESVAWISERKDVLSTPLLIGAMICYVRFAKAKIPGSSEYLRTGVWGFYVPMLLLFALSLMAKTMGVTLPAILLLLDFWPLQRWKRISWFRLFIEKIPLVVISLAAAVLGNIAQYQIGTTPSLSELGMTDRISNAGVCYVMYALKLIVPRHLAVFYPHPRFRPPGAVFAAFALLALLTFVFARLRRRWPYLIAGWFWFLGTLVPVIGLVQIGNQAMADRYSYLPSIGLLMLLVWLGADLLNLLVSDIRRPRAHRRIATGLASVILVIFALVTARQVTYWYSAETLFTHALDVGEESSVAHVALAEVAYERRDIPRTVAQCLAALKFSPDGRAYYVMGNCLIGADPGRAAGYFQEAIKMGPKTVEFHVSLAMAYRLAGDLDKAAAEAQIALDLNRYDFDAQEEMKNIQAARHR